MNHAPSAPAHTPPASATVLPLPVVALACFRRLMHYEGWDVDLARMCADAAYADQCLATAHTSSNERLRRAALSLFDTYGRNRAAEGGFPALH